DYTLQSKATINTGDSILFKPAGLNALKYGLYQRVPIGTNISLLKYFTLSPQATFQQFTNFQTTEQTYIRDTLNTFLRRKPDVAFDQSYQVNLTTKIYGDYVFKSKLLKQIRHQIIPTVGFVFHPNMQNQNFGFYKPLNDDSKTTTNYYSRFSNGLFGGPVGPESGAITFNINNTLDAKVRQKTDSSISYRKVALLQMLSAGGSYDIAAKQNKLSVINVSARTSFFKNIVGVNFNSAFDPYAAKADGRRDTAFEYNRPDHKLARFTNCNFSVNGNLTNAQIKGLQQSKQPFSIGINYNLQFVKTYSLQPTQVLGAPNSTSQIISSQNLGATFSFKPTPMWKFDIRSGYDFKLNSISYTQFTIYRDLRCWEARITWVPFGPTKQYMLTLNLKSPTLSTLKIPKQKLWQDNL
ncbi:MAG: putative LPS assembly protein LptD, partial [Bacteroidia bacterium]